MLSNGTDPENENEFLLVYTAEPGFPRESAS